MNQYVSIYLCFYLVPMFVLFSYSMVISFQGMVYNKSDLKGVLYKLKSASDQMWYSVVNDNTSKRSFSIYVQVDLMRSVQKMLL